MSAGAQLLLDLYRRHMYAMKDGEDDQRKRLFRLINDFEWAFPAIKAEVNDAYPLGKEDQR